MIDAKSPLEWFQQDRLRARESGDPWADLCVMASIEGDSARLRVLVLRDLADGLGVFYSGHSPKARQLDQHPQTELLTYYESIKVQYRLGVALRPISREIIEFHWPRRPQVSKQLDWLYEHLPQGSPIDPSKSLQSLLAGTESHTHPPPGASGAMLEIRSIDRLHLNADGAHERYFFDVGSGTGAALVP